MLKKLRLWLKWASNMSAQPREHNAVQEKKIEKTSRIVQITSRVESFRMQWIHRQQPCNPFFFKIFNMRARNATLTLKPHKIITIACIHGVVQTICWLFEAQQSFYPSPKAASQFPPTSQTFLIHYHKFEQHQPKYANAVTPIYLDQAHEEPQ